MSDFPEEVVNLDNRRAPKEQGVEDADKLKAALKKHRLELLKRRVNMWHTPEGEPYADLKLRGPGVSVPVNSTDFESEIRKVFAETGEEAPGAIAVSTFKEAFAHMAHQGPEHDIVIRKGFTEGRLVYDLGDPRGRVLSVGADGWHLHASSPVRFFRPKGFQPQVEPQVGGDLELLRKYVRVASESDWVLLKSWLLGCFNPVESYPMLLLNGPQGSSKSSTTAILRKLVDPHSTVAFQPPKTDRDLRSFVGSTYVMAFDNVSIIPYWFSDDLCRIATGSSALTTRTLHTTAEMTSIKAVRPVILNGIPDFVERGDLMDRCVQITLASIPPNERKVESRLWAEFEKDRAAILGGIFDLIVQGLSIWGLHEERNLPRMADWANWICCIEKACGRNPQEFLSAYWKSKTKAEVILVANTPFADAVAKLMEKRKLFVGTVGELRLALSAEGLAPMNPHDVGWPMKDVSMTNELKRIAPVLGALGVTHKSWLQGRYIRHELRLEDGLIKTSATQ